MPPYNLPVKSSVQFELVPAGTHIAICDMIVHLGVQPGYGAFKPKPKVYLRFQLPNKRFEYEKDGKKVVGPRLIGQDYTASMSEKANLRHLLASWRGREFTDDEAAKFDIGKALGRPAMIMVMHAKKKDRTYANISGIGPLPDGINPKTIICEGTPLLYTPDHTSTYQLLPEWIRDKIDHQILDEPEREEGRPQSQAPDEWDDPGPPDNWDGGEPPDNGSNPEITDDDIPF
jgi:hypothetical protein